MKVKAVRLYGKNDLRFDEFELRSIRDDEALARVVTDSACFSSYKVVSQGTERPGIPKDIDVNPIIIGHELAAEIIEVGAKVTGWKAGDRFGVQAAMNIDGIRCAPGYNFTEFGGCSTHIIIPAGVLTSPYMLRFSNMPFYRASLGEPFACIHAALQASYHTSGNGNAHIMGICDGGKMAILAGAGPMGVGAVSLVVNGGKRPGLLVVTDIDDARLKSASRRIPPKYAAEKGVDLRYINTAELDNPADELLRQASGGGGGFDDILVMAPVRSVVEQADAISGEDACINFFSGPTDKKFSASVNYYDVHYAGKHVMGTTGSDVDDMRHVLDLFRAGTVSPEVMVTHIGGLNCAAEVTRNLPSVPGGKKLIYTNIEMDLTAIEDFEHKQDPVCKALGEICGRHNLMWSREAEDYLLAHAKPIL